MEKYCMSRPAGFGRILPLGAALMFLAACGEPPDMDQGFPDDPAAGAPEDPAAAPPAGQMDDMAHATTPLQPVGGSGVSGEAMAMHSDDAVVVTVDVEGLPGEGEYPAHIHSGGCEEGGPVAAPLNPVIGTADGMGTSTATLDTDEVPEDEPAFIQVHGTEGDPVACGDIEGHGN